MVGAGSKNDSKNLRPIDGKVGFKANKSYGKFNDGFMSREREMEGTGGNFMVQPINVSVNSNQNKHKVVWIVEKQNFESTIGKKNRIFNFGESSNNTIISYPKDSDVGNGPHDNLTNGMMKLFT